MPGYIQHSTELNQGKYRVKQNKKKSENFFSILNISHILKNYFTWYI